MPCHLFRLYGGSLKMSKIKIGPVFECMEWLFMTYEVIRGSG